MTQQEDFVITKPYVPTEEEAQAIAELESKGLDPHDWETGKKAIQSFKDHLRDYMFEQQNHRCAYCRMQLSTACSYLHREHIVHKDKHPKWIFEPKNLCVACEVCNTNKHEEEVLSNPDVNDYPSDSNDFLIVHPFIDKYSEHISLKDGIVYVGISDKGQFTINTCKLNRPELANERARIKFSSMDTIIAKLVSMIDNPQLTQEDILRIKSKTEAIVNEYRRGNS